MNTLREMVKKGKTTIWLITILLFFSISLPVSAQNAQNWQAELSCGMELYKAGNYAEAAPIFDSIVPIIREIYGNKDTSVFDKVLNISGRCYYFIGQYKKAEPFYQELFDICKEIFGQNHTNYSLAITNLAQLYQGMEQYEQAKNLMIESMQIYREALGEKHPSYITCLNNLATIYMEMGQYARAESLMIKGMQTEKEILGENHISYGIKASNLAALYNEMGRYEQAEPLMIEAMRIHKEAYGENHPFYGTCLNNLAVLYTELGRYEQAEPLMIEAMRIDKEAFGENSRSYVRDLNNLSLIYYDLGRYEQAELMMIEIIEIDKKAYGENHLSHARHLNNLALLYKYLARFEQAEQMMIEAKQFLRRVLGSNHPSYSTCLNNLASLYADLSQYEQAEKLMLEAKQICKEALGENHPSYATWLGNLAQLYKNMGQYEKAQQLMIKSLQIDKEIFVESHPSHIRDLNNLIQLNFIIGQNDKAESLMTEAFRISKKYLKQNTGYLSEKEMKQFIETIFYPFEVYQSYSCKRYDSIFSVGPLALDIELFIKGILLKSVLLTRRSILQSNDSSIISMYQEMITLRKQIDRLDNLSSLQRYLDIDSLNERANGLEKNLALQSKEYRESMEELEVTWNQVKDNLDPGEASIEFASFNYYDKRWTDSTLYCALVLQKDYEYPKMVCLFEEKQLNPLLPSASGAKEEIIKTYSVNHEESKASKIYNLIWNPLEPYLEGVDKVYISASGELNKLAFHTLPDKDGNLLCNKYDLVQLSSTREVALSEEDNSIETFALFGGVDYSLDTTAMFAMAQELNADVIPRAIYRGDTTARGLTLSYLPGTMEEATEIERVCKISGKEVEVFSGKLATEENFRSLEENESPNVIHIATHGFYFPEEKPREREERMRFMHSDQENQFIYSPDPLIRSGLALAGANHAWKGEKIPEGVEDGILTARDVSRMNLMNAELVVLSACQTGLGDVKGSEGVYGLQRAFKMAGVRYLMMSLWKVPDESTKEFMVTFYKHLLSGEMIRDAYQITQQEMIAKYPDDPFRWAAFVLVE